MNETSTSTRDVRVTTDLVTLEGTLSIPEEPKGVVAFVHGSGSSRNSPRNQYVARVLQKGGLITLLFDLLTSEEERVDIATRNLRFDIELLARRTVGAIQWLEEEENIGALPLGLFGASTGAAAALIAAADRPGSVRAVVSRGGRPDLAGAALVNVQCPVLLIVGGLDTAVIDLNRKAGLQIAPGVEHTLAIVPGATHLFDEPGALEHVAELARDWFQRTLTSGT